MPMGHTALPNGAHGVAEWAHGIIHTHIIHHVVCRGGLLRVRVCGCSIASACMCVHPKARVGGACHRSERSAARTAQSPTRHDARTRTIARSHPCTRARTRAHTHDRTHTSGRYAYYAITLMGVRVPPVLKMGLTTLQILQACRPPARHGYPPVGTAGIGALLSVQSHSEVPIGWPLFRSVYGRERR